MDARRYSLHDAQTTTHDHLNMLKPRNTFTYVGKRPHRLTWERSVLRRRQRAHLVRLGPTESVDHDLEAARIEIVVVLRVARFRYCTSLPMPGSPESNTVERGLREPLRGRV